MNRQASGGNCSDAEFFTHAWQLSIPETSRVALRFTATAPIESFLLTLTDSDCLILAEPNPNDLGAVELTIDLAAGDYVLFVDGLDSGEASYTLSVECGEVTECRDCFVDAVTCGETKRGNLSQDDCQQADGTFLDVYRFEMPEAGRVTFDLRSGDIDTVLTLFDSSCGRLARNDDCDGSTDSCLTADLDAGTFHVGVTSFNAQSQGAYELQVSCQLGFSLCVNCLVGHIDCGQTVSGDLSLADCEQMDSRRLDVYELELAQDGTLDINLRSTAFDAVLTLFDSSCQLISQNDDCVGVDSCLRLGLRAGTYFVGASHVFPGGQGPYALEVQATGCTPCTACNDQRVGRGETVEGQLSEASCGHLNGLPADVWSCALEEEARIDFRLESEAFDTVLSVRNAGCQELARNDDCDLPTLNSCAELTLSSGDYLIAVSSSSAGSAGAYQLRVSSGREFALPGDCNGDQRLDVSDGLCLLEALFLREGRELPCGDRTLQDPGNQLLSDFDGNGRIDISDAVGVFGFLFLGNAGHTLGGRCASIEGCEEDCGR